MLTYADVCRHYIVVLPDKGAALDAFDAQVLI
jgi:hypothetical protein